VHAAASRIGIRPTVDSKLQSVTDTLARGGAVAAINERRPLAGRKRPQVVLGRATQHEATVERTSPGLIDEDARTALTTAGYKPREARAAVENARPHVGESATLEQVIREALRQCRLACAPATKPANRFDGVAPCR
jgi:hypothetical protein